MPPKSLQSLKATSSATALKAAATATLGSTGGYGSKTIKLGYDQTVLPGSFGNPTSLKKIDTVWDEEPHDPKTHEQKKNLKSLANKVDLMAGVFQDETRARHEQRQLMDELHDDQMKRLDEISVELDEAMRELAQFIDRFMEKYRTELSDTFSALFSELQEQVDLINPRIAALEARGRVLRAGIDEEREERIRHYAEILTPVKAQIAKLEQELIRENEVRQARADEIQKNMVHAAEALEHALDAEIAAREDRQKASDEEWTKEVDRLHVRQEHIEQACQVCIDGLNEDADKEHEARCDHQDPVVEALTKFMKEFHLDVQEKAEQG
eukprot:TRINITY_DN91731_c0_g1_i1.p1 TRINITY_DN91731_c0_g1~~TRINITY_DN91731_c0_g1_i1.p1  ORF type:complete len:336 (-),score=108.44 TRINITY_DN91731_c0_g1_i1:106-1080(-)